MLAFLAFFVGMGLGIHAQGPNIKFKHISIKDGLSQSSVNTIIQDKEGFMWFGTQDGLNKYDGYEFTVFKHLVDDTTTLTNSYINCLGMDYEEQLWIGTNSGISIYNPVSGQLMSEGSLVDELSPLKSSRIMSFCHRQDSTTWITKYNFDSFRYK